MEGYIQTTSKTYDILSKIRKIIQAVTETVQAEVESDQYSVGVGLLWYEAALRSQETIRGCGFIKT